MYRNTLLILFFALILSSSASALQFNPVGSKAQGMGTAFTAVANDATAVHWNPAGLALVPGWEFQILVSAQVQDHMDIRDNLDDIQDIMDDQEIDEVATDPARVAQLDEILMRLSKSGTGLLVNAGGGLIIKGKAGEHAFAVSGMPLFQGGARTSIDLVNTDPSNIVNNTSQVLIDALQANQYAISYSHFVLPEKLYAGISLKMISGTTYYHDLAVLDPDIEIEKDDLTKNSKDSQKFSCDFGLIAIPLDWLHIGLVGKDINKPEFNSKRPGYKIPVKPQYRAGVAFMPERSFTVALDLDLTENDSYFDHGYKERDIAIGLEKSILNELLAFRVGAFKNIAESGTNSVFTAGLGLRIKAFRMDLGAGYDFDEEQGLVSLNLGARF